MQLYGSDEYCYEDGWRRICMTLEFYWCNCKLNILLCKLSQNNVQFSLAILYMENNYIKKILRNFVRFGLAILDMENNYIKKRLIMRNFLDIEYFKQLNTLKKNKINELITLQKNIINNTDINTNFTHKINKVHT